MTLLNVNNIKISQCQVIYEYNIFVTLIYNFKAQYN